MKPYTMVLPSTALFGSSFGSMFLKTIGNSNASLLLILVFAFVITYSIGYLFMRRPRPVEAAANTTRKETSNIKEESQPLLDESEEQDTSTSDSNNEDPD